jgi:hypothetical protein
MGWLALRRRLSQALGRWLRRWGDLFYRLAGESGRRPAIPAGAPPAHWPGRRHSGPPAAWLERVRSATPGEPPADFFDRVPVRREPDPPARPATTAPLSPLPRPRLAFRYRPATPPVAGASPPAHDRAERGRPPAAAPVRRPPAANDHSARELRAAAPPRPIPRRPLVEEVGANRLQSGPRPDTHIGRAGPDGLSPPPADSWPSLPAAPPAEVEPVEEAARRRERQSRLDEEQRGSGWRASPF